VTENRCSNIKRFFQEKVPEDYEQWINGTTRMSTEMHDLYESQQSQWMSNENQDMLTGSQKTVRDFIEQKLEMLQVLQAVADGDKRVASKLASLCQKLKATLNEVTTKCRGFPVDVPANFFNPKSNWLAYDEAVLLGYEHPLLVFRKVDFEYPCSRRSTYMELIVTNRLCNSRNNMDFTIDYGKLSFQEYEDLFDFSLSSAMCFVNRNHFVVQNMLAPRTEFRYFP
jgi:hypothetical protein